MTTPYNVVIFTNTATESKQYLIDNVRVSKKEYENLISTEDRSDSYLTERTAEGWKQSKTVYSTSWKMSCLD